MECKLDYIEQHLDSVQNEHIINDLKEKHFATMNEILAASYIDEKDKVSSLFTPRPYKRGDLSAQVLFLHSRDDRRKKAQFKFIRELNSKQEANIVKIVKLKDAEIVAVNLIDFMKTEHEEIIVNPEDLELLNSTNLSLEDYIKTTSDQLYKPEFIPPQQKIESRAQKVETDIITTMKELWDNVVNYRNTVENSETKSSIPGIKDNVKKIESDLYFSRDDLSNIDTINKVVNKGMFTLNYINNTIIKPTNSKSLSEQIDDLKDFKDKKYLDRVKKVNNTIDELTELFRFLTPLQSVVSQIKKEQNIGIFYTYNPYRLEREILDLTRLSGVESLNNKQKIGDLFQNESITNTYEFRDALYQILKEDYSREDFYKRFDKILKESEAGNEYLLRAFQEIDSSIKMLAKEIQTSTYDSMAHVIYNEQLKKRGIENEAELEYSEDDDAETKDRKRKLQTNFFTFDTVREKLAIGDSDISGWNSWLGSASELDDTVLRLYTAFIQDEIARGVYKAKEYTKKSNALAKQYDKETRKVYDSKMTVRGIRIPDSDELERYDETNPDHKDKFTVERYGKKYIVEESLYLLNEIDYNQSDADYKFFVNNITELALELVNANTDEQLEAVTVEIAKQKLSLFEASDFYKRGRDRSGNEIIIKKKLEQKRQAVKDKETGEINKKALEEFQSSLFGAFFRKTTVQKSDEDIQQMFFEGLEKEEVNLANFSNQEEAILSQLNKNNTYLQKFITSYKNTRAVKLKDKELFYKIEADQYVGHFLGAGKVLAKTFDGEFKFIEIPLEAAYDLEGQFEDVEYIYQYSGYFKEKNKQFYSDKRFESLQENFKTDSNLENYYYTLLDFYKEGNNKRGQIHRLHYYELANITKTKTKDLKEYLNGTKQNLKDLNLLESIKFDDKVTGIKQYTNDDGEVIYLDDKGNETDKPHYYVLQDRFTEDLKVIKPKLTMTLPADEIETDLLTNITLMNIDAEKYDSKVKVGSTANQLKTILLGNDAVGINKRTVTKGSMLRSAFKKAEFHAEQSTAALLSFVDNFVYETNPDAKIDILGGISTKKLVNKVKFLQAFQVLSFNITASITNVTIGQYNNLSLSIGQKYGMNKKAFTKAQRLYAENLIAMVGDYKKNNLLDKSLYTQLAFEFDAIQGSTEDGISISEDKTLREKMGSDFLFMFSNIPEHYNQYVLMIAFLESYKIKNKNGGADATLQEFIIHKEGEFFEYNEQKFLEFGYTKEEYETEIFNAKVKLRMLNKEAHGAFGQLEGNRLQNHYLFSLAWQFSKWMYSSYRARFRDDRFNDHAGEYDEEGYLKSFYKEVFRDLINLNKEYIDKGFLKTLKDNSLKENLNFAKDQLLYVGKGVLAQGVSFADSLVKGIVNPANKYLNMNLKSLSDIQSISDLIYGENANEEKINRLKRAHVELTWFLMSSLFAMMLHALADDDDEDGFIVQNLDLQLQRFHTDLGFFLPFSGTTTPMERLMLKLQDPLSVERLASANLGLIKNLIGFEMSEEEGIDFYFNDRYKRKGSGYEKDDFKIWVRFKKTVIAPYWNVIKFLNPEDQLQFLKKTYNSN